MALEERGEVEIQVERPDAIADVGCTVATEHEFPVAQNAICQCQRYFVQYGQVYVILSNGPGKSVHHAQTEIKVALRGHTIRKQNCAVYVAVRPALPAGK